MVVHIVNIPNATELLTLKWLMVNFVMWIFPQYKKLSMEKDSSQEGEMFTAYLVGKNVKVGPPKKVDIGMYGCTC